MIPDVPKDCTHSERLVYTRLGSELPDEWVILHSLGVHGHSTKIWGEADIVVLSSRGFFALEVKGGSVSCSDGIWHFGQPGRGGYTKREDPWTQAKDTMFAIKERLCEADPAFGKLLFGYGVVMPMETFTATGPEIEPAVLLDKRDFRQSLARYVALLERHWSVSWKATRGWSGDPPSPALIRKARQILRPDVESAFSVGGFLTAVESKLLQLTNEQIRASRRMASNPRTIVRGKAGTGKTVIAVERARLLAGQGKRVLFLCFNQLLASHIRSGLAKEPNASLIDVRHVHALYAEVIGKAGLSGRLAQFSPDPGFYAHQFPQLFVEAVLALELETWDALVVDEAQDLLTSDNLDAFDLILTNGLARGQWHFFLDPLQNIYDSDIQNEAEARLAPIFPAYDDLFENCRNTRQVATQASIISGIDLALQGAPDGSPCDNVYYGSPADALAKLDEIVKSLTSRDVAPESIAILSTRRRENSALAERTSVGDHPLLDASEAHSGKGAVLFSTMHAFKGLERPVVIAIDMEEIGRKEISMLHYAGLSRACGLLRVLLPKGAKTSYQEQAASFAHRQTLQSGPDGLT